MTELYRCDNEDDGYTIRKFDEDYDLESQYHVTHDTCDCPRGDRPRCRHREVILPLFLKHKHVGDGWFLDFHTHMWRKPIEEGELEDDIEEAQAEMDEENARIASEGRDTEQPVPVARATGGSPPSPQGFRRRI